MTSFPVTWRPPPASYSLVWSQTHSGRQFSTFYSHFQVTSGQITSLPVTSGDLRPHDVISCDVIASSCEIQPCIKSNALYMQVFGLLQPHSSDFRSSDVTSGSILLTWGPWRHFLSHECLRLRAIAFYEVKRTVYASFRPSTATFRWLPVKWRHFRSPEVTRCHFLSLDCLLLRALSLVGSQTHSIRQFSDFYSHFQVTSGQMMTLPGHYLVTWGHVTSFPDTWLPSPASYSLVGSKTHSICQFSAFNSHFQATSSQMTSLPGHFRSPEVTWRHFPSHDCLLLRATALYEVKRTVYASFRPSTATSEWLLFKWRHFRVTSAHLRSRVVISCHVTASSCELQPSIKSNAQCTPVFMLLQPLPGDFRSNDVTSGSFPHGWGHATSFPVTLLPPPASYSLVWCQTQCTPVFGLLQPLPGDFQSNDDTSRSLPVTWGQVTSFPVTWLPPPATYSLVNIKRTESASFQPSRAASRWLQVKWRHYRFTSGHLRSRDVISCHGTASSCELQPCR